VNLEAEKALVASHAATLVRDGMRVGLGTGTTVDHLLHALARHDAKAVYVASSPRTAAAARALGLDVEDFDQSGPLDLALDGADQITEEGWLVKGGGAALTREKIVASNAERFVVMGDSSKLVDVLHPPVPVELLSFGLALTLDHLSPCVLRDVARSPDGGVIADYFGDVNDPRTLAATLSATPGLIEHGLFAPDMVSEIFLGAGESVRRIVVRGNNE
jgi:ribose 5-phosphate isomerase A